MAAAWNLEEEGDCSGGGASKSVGSQQSRLVGSNVLSIWMDRFIPDAKLGGSSVSPPYENACNIEFLGCGEHFSPGA